MLKKFDIKPLLSQDNTRKNCGNVSDFFYLDAHLLGMKNIITNLITLLFLRFAYVYFVKYA